MKKKWIALIMVLSLIFAMTAVGCSSSSDADSSSDASTTETEAPEDTEDVSSEEEEAVDETEEETVDTSEEETPEDETSSSDVTSDEELQGVCDSIRESIIDNYLTPNNLSTEDFRWPSDEVAWLYLDDKVLNRITGIFDEDEISPIDELSLADIEIIDATYTGIINWFEANTDGTSSELSHIVFGVLGPPRTVIPANVTFE